MKQKRYSVGALCALTYAVFITLLLLAHAASAQKRVDVRLTVTPTGAEMTKEYFPWVNSTEPQISSSYEYYSDSVEMTKLLEGMSKTYDLDKPKYEATRDRAILNGKKYTVYKADDDRKFIFLKSAKTGKTYRRYVN